GRDGKGRERGREAEPHRMALAEGIGERVLDRAEEVSRHALAGDRVGRDQVEAVTDPARAQRRDPGGEVPLAHPAADRTAAPGPAGGRALSLSRPRWLAHGSPASSTPVETRLTGPCVQVLLRAAVPVTTPSGPAGRPSPWMDGATCEDRMYDVTRRGCGPADQASIERAESDGKKKNRGPPPSRKALLVGDLAPGEELEVGDQLAHCSARLARVATQLPLELEAPAIAQRAVAELAVGALHVAAPVEEPVDLGEREQAHALLGQVIGDREQAREEPGVMARDLLGE